MNSKIEDMIRYHSAELEHLKSVIYDAEQRMKELGGILAALSKVKELEKEQSIGSI